MEDVLLWYYDGLQRSCRWYGFWCCSYYTAHHFASLQFVKTRPECKIVSSIFFMCLETEFLFSEIVPSTQILLLENNWQKLLFRQQILVIAFGIEPKLQCYPTLLALLAKVMM